MAGLSPGAVQNALATSAAFGASKQRSKERMLSSVAQGVDDVAQGVASKKREGEAAQFLTGMGVSPEEAQHVVAQGPRFFANYVAQKHQEAVTKGEREFATTQATTAFGREKELRGTPTYSDTQQDKREEYARDEADKMKADVAAAYAPVTDVQPRSDLGYSPAGLPTFNESEFVERAPTSEEVVRNLGRRGRMVSGVPAELDAPKQERIDPLSEQGVRAQQQINESKPRSTSQAPRVVTQEMIDAFGLPAGALNQPTADWIRLSEGKANRDAAGQRSAASIAQRVKEASARMSDQDKQAIDALQTQMENTFDAKALDEIVGKIYDIIDRSRGGAEGAKGPDGDGADGEGGGDVDVPMPENATPAAAAAWPKWTAKQRRDYIDAKKRLGG